MNLFFIKIKKYFGLILILIILFSCTASSIKKINSTNNIENKSKTNVTFTAIVKSGVCISCNE